MKSALLLGATGLVGSHCLQLLLANADYDAVHVLSRRPLTVTHDKLQCIVAEFADVLSGKVSLPQVDEVFCCLGTTQKKSGKAGLQRVDHDYVIGSAQQALAAGATQFLVISALGAGPKSLSFYNRVKGEMEADLAKLAFKSIHILQPSLLLGERDDSRVAEEIGQKIMPLFNAILPKKMRPIAGQRVAEQMVEIAQRGQTGVHRHTLTP